jgi:hypothetical protein
MELTFLIYFLLIGGLVLFVVKRPAMALGGILCTYGLEQWSQSQSAFFVEHGTLTNAVTLSVLLLALVIKIRRGERILRWTPVSKAAVVLLGFALVSVLWSPYFEGSVEQWRKQAPYILSFIVLSPLLITRPEDIKDAFQSTLVFGSILLLLLMFTTQVQAGGRGIQMATEMQVADGVTISSGNPLAIASLSAYVALLAILMNFKHKSLWWSLARWIIVIIAMILMVRSGSRGQLIVFLMILPGFAVMSWRPRSPLKLASLAMGLIFLVTVSGWVLTEYADANRWNIDTFRAEVADSKQAVRLNYVHRLIDYWNQSPAYHAVVGLGNSAAFDPDIIGEYPHVVLVEVLAEEGVVGLVLFVAFVFLTCRSLWRLYLLAARDPVWRSLVAVAGALFIYEFMLSFKEGSLIGNVYMFTFAVMLGRFEQVLHATQPQRTMAPGSRRPRNALAIVRCGFATVHRPPAHFYSGTHRTKIY